MTIIVDPDNEYSRFGMNCANLQDLTAKSALPRCSLVFVPSFDRALGIRQFSFLCALAWRLADAGRPVRFVVDELSEFTTAAEAPPEWRRLVKRGRKKGVTIMAASQRPAEIDKTIWSNASLVRTGRLGYDNDQLVIAAALGVPVASVRSLGQLDYLELDRNGSGQVAKGHLTF